MRFRIECCRSGNTLYRLHLRETTIAVERSVPEGRLCWTHRQLRWTWWDDTECSLLYPNGTRQANEPLRIVCGKRAVCCGRTALPLIRALPLVTAVPRLEWEFDGATLVYGKRGCGSVVRQNEGRSLAVWRPRHWYWWFAGFDGVWRRDLPGVTAAVVFGTILAQLHGARES